MKKMKTNRKSSKNPQDLLWILAIIIAICLTMAVFTGCRKNFSNDEFARIFAEQRDCYSKYFKVDLSELVEAPQYMVSNFRPCSDGCTWVFNAKLGDRLNVAHRNDEPVIWTIGDEIVLFFKNGQYFVNLVLIQRDYGTTGLAFHEATHSILEQAKMQGVVSVDTNVGHAGEVSVYFTKNSPCPKGATNF